MTEPQEMRGLSLYGLSPHAIAYGAKKVETRSWKCNDKYIGQRIAIHASKTKPPGGMFGLQLWMREPLNIDWLVKTPYMDADGTAHPELMPTGAFVATAVVADCVPTEDLMSVISDLEWTHGDYSPGRWGWVLESVRRLTDPVPYIGSYNLYKIEPTALFSDDDTMVDIVGNIQDREMRGGGQLKIEPTFELSVADRLAPMRHFGR